MGKTRLRPNLRGGRSIIIPQSAINSEQGMYRAALESIVVPMAWQLVVEQFISMLREGKALPEGQDLESFYATCLDMAKTWSSVSLAWKEERIKEMSDVEEISEVPEKAAARSRMGSSDPLEPHSGSNVGARKVIVE